MKIFKFIVLFLCFGVLVSCSSENDGKYADYLKELQSNYGGELIYYNAADNSEPPTILKELYSRGGETPDEFNMIESTFLWYRESFDGGDAAVFKVLNATDAKSVAKMCARRENTLKYSAGIKSQTIIDGHYVVFLNIPR